MPRSISRASLQASLAGSAAPLLAEALPAKYYLDGHLPGAKHLPLGNIEQIAPEALPDKQQDIIVYCASSTCRNSHTAAAELEALGYENVHVYEGGKADWTDAGLPLEKGAGPA